MLGSLARSDFGLLPFSFFVAAGLYGFIRPRIMPLGFPFVGLLGSVVGILLVLIHNYIFTNQFLQSSARMKGYWAQFEMPNYYIVPLLLGALMGTIALFILASFIVVAILPKFVHRGNNGQLSRFSANENIILMLFGSCLCLVGYMVVYAHSSAIQIWYTANLITPFLLIIWAVSEYLKFETPNDLFAWICSIILVPLLISASLSRYSARTEKAPWPWQEIMLQAGQYLDEQKIEGLVGSWNAGIIGYYGGGHVVNLDGLVNNDIYEYAVTNTLPSYIDEKKICYIVDFENMLKYDSLRLRGGYDHRQWIEDDFEAIHVFDDGRFGWQYLTLYHISSPNCSS
jgi:hypothetical protein